MQSYEVHFFRADGTLSLRIFTIADSDEAALYSVRNMRSTEFAAVKVWRGVERVPVRHRLVTPPVSEPEEKRAG